jgi:hypothetical protein
MKEPGMLNAGIPVIMYTRRPVVQAGFLTVPVILNVVRGILIPILRPVVRNRRMMD